MTGQQAFFARGSLGIIAAVASTALARNNSLRQLSSRSFDRLVTISFVASRLLVYLGVFVIAGIPARGDIPAYYLPEAESALRGLLPYRDFVSSYAPLHAYLDAIPVRIWHSPLSIILLAILAECFLLPLWMRFGRAFFSESELRTGALLYLGSAVSLQYVTIDGQDTVLIAVFIAIALLFLSRRREFLSGLSLGTSIAVIKFLPLIFVPSFFFAIPRRWRWLSGFAVPIFAVYGAFVLMDLPILVPVGQEANLRGVGNLPYLIESLSGILIASRLWDTLLIVVFSGIIVLTVRSVYKAAHDTRLKAAHDTRLRLITFSIAALTLALLLFSKKSWPPYLMLALFPICALVDTKSRTKVVLFAGLNVCAVIEHSYWATFIHQVSALELHQGLAAGLRSCYLLLAMQAALLIGYAWLLTLAIRQIQRASLVIPQSIDSKGDFLGESCLIPVHKVNRPTGRLASIEQP